jgi:threonine dehydratase
MSAAAETGSDPHAVSFADVEAAAERIRHHGVRTPLLTCPTLDELTGARVFVKAECLQRTGTFKFRGAYNRIALISEEERANGVVAASSGNHAQGVAEAARLFGISATIIMPDDAPAIKKARTERSGARVITYDRQRENRIAIANAVASGAGATFVHPFDDPGVIAGQGTVGLEIAADCADAGVTADRVLVPASGGGLLGGIAVALDTLMPSAACQPVEPAGFDDLTRSLKAGHRVRNEARSGSIADALLVEMVGRNTFAIHQRHVSLGVAVPDAALFPAMAFAANELKLVVEPGGVIGLAALLGGFLPVSGETVVVVLSGGNVDPSMMARALTA